MIGVFEASVYGQSGLGAPAERKPAGIFLDIEPGDGIAGVMLYMEVGYDPAALPKGMSESSLRLYHYVDGGWHLLTSGVNTDSDYVWAEVDSFSPLASSAACPPPVPPVRMISRCPRPSATCLTWSCWGCCWERPAY